MRLSLRILAAASIFISSICLAGNGALSLDEAWQMAVENDPVLKASEQRLNENMGNKTSATASFIPHIDGSFEFRQFIEEEGFIWDSGTLGLGVLPFPSTDKSVPKVAAGLEQLVFDSGKSIAQYNAARHGVDAARHNIFASSQNRAIDLVDAYSKCYLAQRRLEVVKSAAAAFAEHERVAGLRYQQDQVSKTDLLSAEVEASKARLTVTTAEDNFNVARKNLASIIGVEPEAVVEPKVPPPPIRIEPTAERPEIKAKTSEMRAAKSEATKAGLSYLPDFIVRAEASYTDDSYRLNKQQYSFMGGVKWPLFDGLYNAGQRRQAIARATRNLFEREAMQNDFAVELEDATRAWKRSDAEISTASLNRKRASENLKDANLGYKEGMVSALEVRDAVKLWSEAEYNYHEAICARQLAAAKLRRAASVGIFEEEGGVDVTE